MTQFAERRIEVRLPIRRINVVIAGAVLSTVDISNDGAQVHCPKAQFGLIKPLLESDIELVIELPIGREVTVYADVSYIRESAANVFIGFKFHSFKYRDQLGWQAFVAAKRREASMSAADHQGQKISHG